MYDAEMLQAAAALSFASRMRIVDPHKTHHLVALGISRSGHLRYAVNRTAPGAGKTPSGHAERCLLRKARGVREVYVARTTATGEWALARPCATCNAALKAAGVKRVVFTSGPKEYSVLYF